MFKRPMQMFAVLLNEQMYVRLATQFWLLYEPGLTAQAKASIAPYTINHARHALSALEAGANESRQQVDLFAAPPESEATGPSPIEVALAQINPDALSPREALDALYKPPRIIFSHGNSFPASTYRVMLDSLRQRGFQVDAVEMYGHDPKYPVTNNWPYLVQQLADFARDKQNDYTAAALAVTASEARQSLDRFVPSNDGVDRFPASSSEARQSLDHFVPRDDGVERFPVTASESRQSHDGGAAPQSPNGPSEPAFLVGHSLGGILSLMCAARHPELVRGVVLIDSPVLGGWRATTLGLAKRTPLIGALSPGRISQKRRNHWPDAQAALESFAHKKSFARWDPQVLRDYIEFGTHDEGGQRVLNFDRDIETAIYNSLPHKLDSLLKRHPLKCAAAFIGGTHSAEMRQAGADLTHQVVKGRIMMLDGSHLFPMEKPIATRSRLKAAASKAATTKAATTKAATVKTATTKAVATKAAAPKAASAKTTAPKAAAAKTAAPKASASKAAAPKAAAKAAPKATVKAAPK
eukprot:gene36596-45135_t